MRKVFKIIGTTTGILLLLVLVTGFIIYKTTSPDKLRSFIIPEVRYVTVTNARITETLTTMDVQLEVTSKLVPVFIDSMVYDIRLGDQTLTQGSKKFADSTKADQVQTLLIPVALNRKQVQDVVMDQLTAGHKIEALVEAYYRLPVGGLKRYDLRKEIDMAVPFIPNENLLNQ